MPEEFNIVVKPEEAEKENLLRLRAAEYLKTGPERIADLKILKRSIDARSKFVQLNLKLRVWIFPEKAPGPEPVKVYPVVSGRRQVLIIGAGPAGLFAALRLIELGFTPLIIERGKDVKSRRRDLALINRAQGINPDSNYCFGEGGAGTYSDGKLYTRSTKRGDLNGILKTFVAHGASESILVDAHPHIGTNKLPEVIVNIRETILNAGGEILFNSRVTDLLVKENRIRGVVCGEKEFLAGRVILATGHSARDIYNLLSVKKIRLESKSFAMGVRIEHQQTLIDKIQYHTADRGPWLPPASYSLVQQVNGKGVFSFCMCPGGIIAPCATGPGEIVTNGWSPSKRNNPWANSGIVVGITPADLGKYSVHGVLAGLRYQQDLEHMAFEAGGKSFKAPAQRMSDFCTDKLSENLPSSSYQPGLTSAPLHDLMPSELSGPLKVALREFGKKMKGYFSNEAVLVGVESRTSSPLRIPRDEHSLEHPDVKGLYPCAEGAGYAGGIMSAAIDGQKCAEAISASY